MTHDNFLLSSESTLLQSLLNVDHTLLDNVNYFLGNISQSAASKKDMRNLFIDPGNSYPDIAKYKLLISNVHDDLEKYLIQEVRAKWKKPRAIYRHINQVRHSFFLFLFFVFLFFFLFLLFSFGRVQSILYSLLDKYYHRSSSFLSQKASFSLSLYLFNCLK